MNNNFLNKINKKNLVYIFASVAIICICSILTYVVADRLTNPKYAEDNQFSEEGKLVYNATEKLNDNFGVILMSGEEVVTEQSLSQFKSDNNISVDVTEQFLISYLEAQNYKLEAIDHEKIVFKKEIIEEALVPNKFYLGEKDGYFAIYKTDNSGRPFIESDSDIFKEYKMVNTIPVSAEEDIKSFKHYYDSKSEALERLAGYLN